ncbi:MAG TPA: HupE/UreJ family protein [Bryobacteraceae bacterium]|nr:HupE/UreJ family protein [Bryobacteraceae bacterium]
MRSFLFVLLGSSAFGHVVSMSSGELHVEGRMATYELRIPMYEVAHVTNPETALLDHVKFEGAQRTSSSCMEQDGTYICRAAYQFDRPVPDKIEAECTLFEVTVPNHVHLLYAVQGTNSDQEVFDQSFRRVEVRFHPPSRAELIAKDAAAGIARLFRSVSGLLFLAVLVLAARSTREAGILALAFLAGEWLARPISPHIPLAFSPEFLEAVLALTVAYLAAEIVFLPESQARWAVVPILGIAHGLAFAAFPASYLTAASITQTVFLGVLWLAVRKLPAAWRRPAAGVLLVAGIGWFARMLV